MNFVAPTADGYLAGRTDAKGKFVEFLKVQPQSPLKSDAELRIGFCQVQLKEYGEALKTLQPLADQDKRLADQALFWIGKARAGATEQPKASGVLAHHVLCGGFRSED